MSETKSLPVMLSVDEAVKFFSDHGAPSGSELLLACIRLGRNQGPTFLADLEAEGLLTPEAAAMVVPSVWSAVEFPNRSLPAEVWRWLFQLAGYTIDGVPAGRPIGGLTLFRRSTRAARHGWSWTEDESLAEHFASGGLGGRATGRVWKVHAPSESLLARIPAERPGESEYVVDTDGLAITPRDLR